MKTLSAVKSASKMVGKAGALMGSRKMAPAMKKVAMPNSVKTGMDKARASAMKRIK